MSYRKLKYPIPEVGTVIEYWTILDNNLFEIKPHRWGVKCKCKCGNISYVRVNALMTGKSKGCPCRSYDMNRESRSYVGDISDTYWNRIIKAAIKRKKDFNITKEYVWDLFITQDKKCALSGLDIIMEKSINRKRGMANITASLDRIDSKKGYIEGNVQWVHKDINKMKQDLDEEYFKQLCKLIIKNE